MKFLYMDIFYLSFIPFVLFIIVLIRSNTFLSNIFNKEIYLKLIVDNNAISRVTRNAILCIALFFMIVSLGRPVIEKADEKIKKEGGSIVFGIDISKSMLATDVYPNRLEAGKKKAIEFASLNANNQIGIISFSSHSFMLSPLSLDMDAVGFLIHNLDTSSISSSGTNILSVLQSANELLKQRTQKLVVIFSDGGDDSDFNEEIEFALKNNIIVSVLNIGSVQGSPIPDKKGFLQDSKNNIVIVKRNDSIKQLALKTGGVFATWSYDSKDIKSILEHFNSIVQKQTFDEKVIKNYTELFIYPLLVSVILLLIAFSSLPINLVRKNYAIIFLSLLFFNPQNINAGILDFLDLKKANQAYEKKDFSTSSVFYEKIAKSKKTNQSYYNLANSYYKEGNYKKALQNYKKVKNIKDVEKSKLLHNMGNTYAKLNKLQEAKDSYMQSLNLNKSEDTKYNLKIIEKLLKKQEQQKKEQQKKDNKKQSDKDKKDKNKKDKESNNKDGKNKDDKKDKKDDKNKDDKKDKKDGNDKNNKKGDEEKNNKKEKNNKLDYDSQEESKKASKKQQATKERKFISKAEERKWLKKIKKQNAQVMPVYKFKFEGKSNAKGW